MTPKIGQKVWTTVSACGEIKRMAQGIVTAIKSGYCEVDIMSLHGGAPWIVAHSNCSIEPVEGYSKCPRCGYYAFDGSYCWDCDYRSGRGED